MERILVEISPGELLDKISILEIKAECIEDPAKRANVSRELESLAAVRDRCLPHGEELGALADQLKSVNRQLWEVEDAIRDCERRQDFGADFIALARRVYLSNDQRSEIKRRINLLLASEIIEEKAYVHYSRRA